MVRLTITTWNLQGSKGVDVEAVAGHLREQNPDVVLLQEVQRRQARDIRWALGAKTLHWSFKHWPVRVPAEGMAILGLTVPLSVRARGITHRWNPFTWRRRIIQLGRVVGDDVDADSPAIVNVHLTPHGPTSEADRAAEVAWLLRRLQPTRDTVVGGDFNAASTDVIFAGLTNEGLRDAWPTVHGLNGTSGNTNWHGPRNRAPNKRIDYLWASGHLFVEDAEVPAFGTPGFETYPGLSDHLPLTARFAAPAED